MSTKTLNGQIRNALAWSTINAFVLRLGTFGIGILLAYLLVPEEFGVFAIALTVQTILMSLADFGLSTDLIRSANHAAKAPTVATLGLLMGSSMFLIMFFTAQQTAELLGSPEAGPVIALMSTTLLLSALGVVPYAKLQRDFQQKRLFMISLLDFVVSNAITVALLLSGWGVISLAIGRVSAQVVTLVAQYIMAQVVPRFGFSRDLAPQVIRFGLPVAAANMLSWMLLNVDNVTISRLAGPTALGFYYLAFNISSWPMNMLGQIVRSIALPAFARIVGTGRDRSLGLAVGPVWALGLLAGLMLAVLAGPVIEFVYPPRWAASVPILMALGVFGSLRMVFDLFATYLLAKGRSGTVLIVQTAWLAALVPTLVVLVSRNGGLGAGIAQLAVGLLLVIPVYAVALWRSNTDIVLVRRQLLIPVGAAVPAALAAYFCMQGLDTGILKLLVGGLAGALIYGAILYRWFRKSMSELIKYNKQQEAPADDAKRASEPEAALPNTTGGE